MMRHSVRWVFTLGLLSLCSSGCATEEFSYVPTEHHAPLAERKDEAVYAAPSGSPTATIRIVSMGIAELKDTADTDSTQTLHIRMSVSNKRDAGSWLVSARDQTVSFPNQTPVQPLAVKSGALDTPKFEIKPDELRSIDLYFPLPKNVLSSKDLTEFDLHWEIRSGSKIVRETTLFDRVQAPETLHPYASGWGAPWAWDGGSGFGSWVY